MGRINDRADEVSKELEQYAGSLGLNALSILGVEDDVQRLLGADRASLRKLTAIECGEGAFTLYKYAEHLQQAVNRERVRLAWAEETVRRLIASELAKQKGYSFEERRIQAVAVTPEAAEADAIRVKAQLRIERVAYLANKVENLANTLLTLQNTKRGNRGE